MTPQHYTIIAGRLIPVTLTSNGARVIPHEVFERFSPARRLAMAQIEALQNKESV